GPAAPAPGPPRPQNRHSRTPPRVFPIFQFAWGRFPPPEPNRPVEWFPKDDYDAILLDPRCEVGDSILGPAMRAAIDRPKRQCGARWFFPALGGPLLGLCLDNDLDLTHVAKNDIAGFLRCQLNPAANTHRTCGLNQRHTCNRTPFLHGPDGQARGDIRRRSERDRLPTIRARACAGRDGI